MFLLFRFLLSLWCGLLKSFIYKLVNFHSSTFYFTTNAIFFSNVVAVLCFKDDTTLYFFHFPRNSFRSLCQCDLFTRSNRCRLHHSQRMTSPNLSFLLLHSSGASLLHSHHLLYSLICFRQNYNCCFPVFCLFLPYRN